MNLIRTGRLASFAAAALVLAACESQPTASVAAPLHSDADRLVVNVEDVQEATLRYMFSTKGATGMDAYCVSTGFGGDADTDPATTLLDRFAGNVPPVVALSGCTISVSGDTYNATGGPAEWFKVGTPTVTGRTATIQTGFHINGRLAESFVCDLRYRDAWTVTGCVLTGAA